MPHRFEAQYVNNPLHHRECHRTQCGELTYEAQYNNELLAEGFKLEDLDD